MWMISIVLIFMQRLEHPSLAIAKANPNPLINGKGPNIKLIAILNKLPPITTNNNLIPATPSKFQQRSILLLFITTDRT
jgi:hypothetical protein